MTAVLGISAFYHDSAAALVVDGEIVAAAQEERFTRKKHDENFPAQAIDYCLSHAGLTPETLDYVAFYEKPLLKFDRLLETYLAYAPRGFRSFTQALPIWVKKKLFLNREMRRGLPGYSKRFIYPEHHESHAASAFFPSPFDEAAILTVDGVGEWATASFGTGRGNKISLTHELHFPHSPGLLYSAFTYYCGFRVNSGEYKLMGLAPYGEPKYAELIRKHLIELRPDGSFRLDMSYFNYCQGLTMTSRRFHDLFGGPPRSPESLLTQREMDLAASVQVVLEEILYAMADHVYATTGQKRLCLAGGVALNCVANGKLLRRGPFEEIWIQPAAGDAGGALGAALLVWHQLLNMPRTVGPSDSQRGSLLGPEFGKDDVRARLTAAGAKFYEYADESELLSRVVDLLEQGKVVGWVQGRMEFGPRALGCRSIIGDARNREMQSTMNLKIKFRESFRPFAPVVLADRAHEIFEMAEGLESPYMLLVADVQTKHRLPVPTDERGGVSPPVPQGALVPCFGLEKLKQLRSTLPAITHVDYSARVQTIDPIRHGRFHRLMKQFEARTACPVLINTSFNVRGEPIVHNPEDAFRCFLATEMDVLVVEDCLLLQSEQDPTLKVDRDKHLSQFQLD